LWKEFTERASLSLEQKRGVTENECGDDDWSGPYKPRKGCTGHAPSEKVAVGINRISIHSTSTAYK